MASASDTIKLACQMTGMLGLGQPMSSALAAEGLGRLNQLLRRVFSSGAWLDQRLDSAYDVPSNLIGLRLQCMAGCRSVSLPEMSCGRMRDGLRVHVIDAALTAASSNLIIDRNGWPIDGAQSDLTISTNGGEALLMLDAASGTFRKWAALPDINTSLPLPTEFDEDIALCLARAWSGARRFGQSLSADEMDAARKAWKRLRARYAKPPPMLQTAAASTAGGESTAYGFNYATGEDWA